MQGKRSFLSSVHLGRDEGEGEVREHGLRMINSREWSEAGFPRLSYLCAALSQCKSPEPDLIQSKWTRTSD